MGPGSLRPAARRPRLLRPRASRVDAGPDGVPGFADPRAREVPELLRPRHARARPPPARGRPAREAAFRGRPDRGGIPAGPGGADRRAEPRGARSGRRMTFTPRPAALYRAGRVSLTL